MRVVSFTVHFNLWCLRRLILSIRQSERNMIGERQSLGMKIEQQTQDTQRHRLEEFKELVIDEETERLHLLKMRALKVYQRLQATPLGREL